MLNEQMELGIGKARVNPSLLQHHRKAERARWWFERMRRVVDSAIEPAPKPRPEQIWFPE